MTFALRKQNKSDAKARCFGLRIENHLLQLAVATPRQDGRYRVEIDNTECPSPAGWLNAAGVELLVDAIRTLVGRYEIRRDKVAVSLDGDFCVTRVTMGSADEVDNELAMLADRVPRYLQLGPGEKVTGRSRTKIDQGIDYAVTGVVHRSLIQLIYDAMREADVNPMWVEPSLVSISRLVDQAKIDGDAPIMVADGAGTSWDVGIACRGRLLLDYRPSAVTDEETFSWRRWTVIFHD